MTELRIHQLAAVAMMVSGLLLGLSYISHPHQMPPAVIAGKSWFFIHAGFLASLIIGLLGTTGFYARTMARTGYLGFTGYLFIFIGMILIAGLDYYETLIAPHLAIEFPMVIEKYGPGDTMGPVAVAFPLSGALTVTGFVLLGVANIRGGTFRKWPMSALVVTAIIFGVGLSPIGGILAAQVGAGVFGLALVWAGWSYLHDANTIR